MRPCWQVLSGGGPLSGLYQYQHTTPLVSVPPSCTDGCTYSREGDRETYCFVDTGEYRIECTGGEKKVWLKEQLCENYLQGPCLLLPSQRLLRTMMKIILRILITLIMWNLYLLQTRQNQGLVTGQSQF